MGKRRKLRIAMDFDGVIGTYTGSKDWVGPDKLIRPPIEGVIPWMCEMIKAGHKIILFSMRNADNGYIYDLDLRVQDYLHDLNKGYEPKAVQPVLIDVGHIATTQRAMIQYLIDHGMPEVLAGTVGFSLGKPHFDIYIDDRGWRFNGDNLPSIPEDVAPWWKNLDLTKE